MSAERIGIAGGGAIASGLACVAAEHGQVVLWARRPDAATAKVERLIEKRGGLGAGNVSVSDDLDCLCDATFVVEAIAEEPAAKAELLGRLGGAATNGTILATTTSALSIGELAARDRPAAPLRRPARVQPGREDGPDRARLPRRGRRGDARARRRALRGAGQDRGRGARHAGLRRQPPALPVPLRRGRAARGERARARGDRRVHAARRRAPDGAARAARLRRASTSPRRSAARSARRCPRGSRR